MILPKQLTFGEQQIPSQEIQIQAINQKDIHIADESTLEKSNWTVKLREGAALTNQNGHQLSGAINWVKNGHNETINSDDQLIWQGSGNAAFSDENQIQLVVLPTYEIGHYQGSLVWTIEDAPK